MRIWITRAEPGASETARRLTELGHEPLVAPVLEVSYRKAKLDLSGVAALAFTSRNGVEGFSRLSVERSLPVFAVGAATAEAARAAGFGQVESAEGDVHALAAMVAASPVAKAGVILNPGAAEPAADLAALLAERGATGRHAAVYETITTPAAEAPAQFDAVLIHSPKAGRIVADMLANAAEGVVVFAISPAALAPLTHLPLAGAEAAAEPNEAALLALLPPPSPPGDEGPPPRLLGPAFWLLLAFGFLCVVGGALIAFMGPGLMG